jgi:hypothetical protein
MVAGLCIYLENAGDAGAYARGLPIVRTAEGWCSDAADTAYWYAVFFTRAGDRDRAFNSLDSAIRRDYDLEKLLDDPNFQPLRDDPRFEREIVDRVMRWKIASQPPGASVWLDDVDTGLVTPAKMRPPAVGKHLIRLSLAGYADYRHEMLQSGPEHGLQLTAVLQDAKLVAEREAARERAVEDSTRAPGTEAQARTRAFIGKRGAAEVIVHRNTTYGLGGLRIIVHGDGQVKLEKEGWGQEPSQRHALTLPEADVARIFDAFVTEAFTEMQIGREPGYPDEIYLTVTLKGAGGTHELGKFGRPEHQRFDRLVGIVRFTVAAHLDAERRKALTL